MLPNTPTREILKKILLRMAVFCIAVPVLAGCKNTSTPEGVFQAAYKALMENKPKAFRKTLTSGMQARYANEQAMAELKRIFGSYPEFVLSEEALIDQREKELPICAGGDWYPKQWVVTHQLFGTRISGKRGESVNPLFNAQVSCQIRYTRRWGRGGECYQRLGEYCLISELVPAAE